MEQVFEISHLVWWILAVVLVVSELASGTLVFLFFAASAVITALFQGFFHLPFWASLLIFGAGGLVLLIALRKVLQRVFQSARADSVEHPDRHQTAVAREEIAAGREGALDYQGSVWIGVNRGSRAVRAGERVSIVHVDGIKLAFKKEV